MKKMYPLMFIFLFINQANAAKYHHPASLTNSHANNHAPIGVMGDHLHQKNQWMFSYRFMRMEMADNLQGSNNISPEKIVTTVPNRFFGQPMMPPTLRVVPQSMTTDMHMFGVMFAPNDDITLMGMLNLIDKKMQHTTFAGGKGQTLLGQFTTHSSGLGDVKLSALTSLYQGNVHKVHLNIGLSLPTAKIDNTDVVLTPMNMQVEQRLPYGMQLGTGTFDLMFGATYSAHLDKYNWGGQINYTASIESENDQGYQIGDRFWATWWTGYEINPALSTSLRLIYRDSDKIKGIDSHIIAPVATADPNNYGGNNTALALGLNYIVQTGTLKGHRLAVEYESVLTQKVNGIQLQMSDMLTIGYQVSF